MCSYSSCTQLHAAMFVTQWSKFLVGGFTLLWNRYEKPGIESDSILHKCSSDTCKSILFNLLLKIIQNFSEYLSYPCRSRSRTTQQKMECSIVLVLPLLGWQKTANLPVCFSICVFVLHDQKGLVSMRVDLA